MKSYVDEKHLIQGVRDILNSCQKMDEYSVCLQSLLSTIDVCASKNDDFKNYGVGKRYREFCKRYFKSAFFEKLRITPDWLYDLRCSVLHSGDANCAIVLYGSNISIGTDIKQVSLTDLCYELLSQLGDYIMLHGDKAK